MTPLTVEVFINALRDELIQLWGDMFWARAEAYREWSMRCENLAERIVTISRIVGPAPWEHISVDLLRDGTYERVHHEGNIPHLPIDWERVAEVEGSIL